MENKFDPFAAQDEFKETEFSTWTIWNIVQLCISGVTFGFYVYILVAIIIGGIEGFGQFDPTTALLTEPWNLWIFLALNLLSLISTVAKVAVALFALEKIVEFDESVLYWFD